jgi:hypothetical protein
MSQTPSNPKPNKGSETHSLDSAFFVIEGGEDTTRRPRRPHIPLPPPEDQPPQKPKDKPSEGKQ